ncbi:MAG: HAD family hydrolase [Candidatus Asgardarchaeia archaeon]
MTIDVIFFDLDETLYDYYNISRLANKEVANLVQALGICDEKRFRKALKKATEIAYKKYGSKPKVFDRRLRFKIAFTLLKVKPSKDLLELLNMKYWSVVFENIKPYPDVVPTLTTLKDMGIRIGILSDGLIEIQKKRLKALGISRFFEFTIFSEEVGINKPSPKLFRYALHVANANPKNSAMVGDNIKTDVYGANRVGMTSIWIRRGRFKDVSPSSNKEIPKFVIDKLDQILRLSIFSGEELAKEGEKKDE